MKKFAVILSGCGTSDGSEINETVTLLLALDQHGIKYQCFAPDRDQYHVVDHFTGKILKEKRNMLSEAARISRGDIKPLSEFKADDFDGLAIPGGVGTGMNLFTYFVDGVNMTVLPEVEKAILDIHAQGKPICAMCIAPMLLAKVLKNIDITLGDSGCKPAQDAKAFGTNVISAGNGEVVSDLKNKIYTTPCFMLNATLKDIYNDAFNLVEAMVAADR